MKRAITFVLAACLAGTGFLATAGAVVTRPTTAPASAPASGADASDPYIKRLTFLGDQLAADEATIAALNKALVVAGYKAALAADKVANSIKGNELMDRNAGGPVPWQNFYGRTAKDFAPRDIVGIAHNYQRPTQFNYVYRANDTVAAQARTDVDAMGKKTDALLARRAQLEAEQSSLWATLAFESIENRDIALRPIYRDQLKADPGNADDSRPDAARLAAIRAAVVYLRTADHAATKLADRLGKDQDGAFGTLRDTMEKALNAFRESAATFSDTPFVDSAEVKQLTEAVNQAKRVQAACKDICEAYTKAKDADKAQEDQRKLLYRGTLQDSLFTFAETTADLDGTLMKMFNAWDIIPVTGVKSADAPGELVEAKAGSTDDKTADGARKVDLTAPFPTTNGWVNLFNGKDFAGWDSGGVQGPRGGRGTADWQVTDGLVVARGGRGRGSLSTAAYYTNFQFRLKTRLSEGSDSAIAIVPENATRAPVYVTIGSSNSGVNVITGDISLNDLTKASAKKVALTPDEWFTLRIDYNGKQLGVFVNGDKVSEYADKEIADIHGKIELVHRQNSTLQVKEMQVRDLALSASPSSPPAAQDPARGGRGRRGR